MKKNTTTFKLTDEEIQNITYALINYRNQMLNAEDLGTGLGFSEKEIDYIKNELAGQLSGLIKRFEAVEQEIWNKIGRGE